MLVTSNVRFESKADVEYQPHHYGSNAAKIRFTGAVQWIRSTGVLITKLAGILFLIIHQSLVALANSSSNITGAKINVKQNGYGTITSQIEPVVRASGGSPTKANLGTAG